MTVKCVLSLICSNRKNETHLVVLYFFHWLFKNLELPFLLCLQCINTFELYQNLLIKNGWGKGVAAQLTFQNINIGDLFCLEISVNYMNSKPALSIKRDSVI